jgi:catechol 2,3-dioxygenase-like lactoylglutathione lyase family enzyme
MALTTARFTHVALPSADIDASVAWYRSWTPLVVVHERTDEEGRTVWLSNPGESREPFVLVLIMFWAKQGIREPQLTPFAHLGIECVSRAEVDAAAERARDEGCLAWEPADRGHPIGYICAVHDPGGNVVEFSHDQAVHDTVQDAWPL